MPKHDLPRKAFGIFPHRNLARSSPVLRGISDDFAVPVSRWTEVRRQDIPPGSGLAVLAESDETGVCLLDDPGRRSLHMFNHLEYDTMTLAEEYARDAHVDIPRNYFPGDDPARLPVNAWRSHAHLLFGNWINEIYQTTPFDVSSIGCADRQAS
jgi:homoserine O-succinyltransferase